MYIMKHLREVRNSLFDSSMNIKDNCDELLFRAGTSKDNCALLQKIFLTFIESESICEESRLYLIYSDSNIKDITDKIKNTLHKDINYDAAVKRLNKDDKDLCNLIGKDTVKNLIYNNNVIALDEVLGKFFDRYGASLNNIKKLKIDINSDIVKKSIDRESFNDVLKMIEPYLVYRIKAVESFVKSDANVIGYINYLLSSESSLDSGVINNRLTLMKFLNNLDFSTVENIGEAMDNIIDRSISYDNNEESSLDINLLD